MRTRLAVLALAVATAVGLAARALPPGHWTLIGWNDLGMHCMDSDYSVSSLLPPFNTVRAQLIEPDGDLVTDGTLFTVTYEAVADPGGSINESSIGKTNYWSFADVLYGASTVPDTGLLGNDMPGPANVPQPMSFYSAESLFEAPGIPITPYDDARHKRPYPMMRLVARNQSGQLLAETAIVLPVSDEMDCSACHSSGSGTAAQPVGGWVYAREHSRDFRLNVLRLHDDLELGNPVYDAALVQAGYSPLGLHDTVQSLGTPILCARCHASNALPGTGFPTVSALTAAMHSGHATVADPDTGLPLDDSQNRASCYRCHPGSETRCLRGAMGAAVSSSGDLAMQCQSCHGKMSVVGDPQRVGWLDQPNCQACHTGTATHNNGQIRYTDAFESDGSLRQAVDDTFATNPDVPAPGFSLYRFSIGHGGLQCEACHGSTHAEYPASHPNDNLQSEALQGHVGLLVECTSCHDSVPETFAGGPHGMHPVGQSWIDDHKDAAQQLGKQVCAGCHGADYRGTVLSIAQADRTLQTEFGTLALSRGQRIGCYNCHRGPDSDDENNNLAPVAQDDAGFCVDQPTVFNLQASDPDSDPLTLRIVHQPSSGRVGLSGTVATYYPDPGASGLDVFQFAAWDGDTDSNLATVTVTRGATWANYSRGYPGTGGAIPQVVADGNPVLGSTIHVDVGNTSGVPTLNVLFAAAEPAALDTRYGGMLLAEFQFLFFLPLPASGASFTAQIPNDPNLIGITLHVQSLQADPGARYGIAFSRGLRLNFGL